LRVKRSNTDWAETEKLLDTNSGQVIAKSCPKKHSIVFLVIFILHQLTVIHQLRKAVSHPTEEDLKKVAIAISCLQSLQAGANPSYSSAEGNNTGNKKIISANSNRVFQVWPDSLRF
jgi:hypothetical protein